MHPVELLVPASSSELIPVNVDVVGFQLGLGIELRETGLWTWRSIMVTGVWREDVAGRLNKTETLANLICDYQ